MQRLGVDKSATRPCDVNREAQTYGCAFRLDVINEGEAEFVGPVVLNDRVLSGPAPTAVEVRRGEGWQCPGTDGTGLSCLNGALSLAPGAGSGVQVVVTLPGLRQGGRFCNAASVGLEDTPFQRTIVVQQVMALLDIDGGPADGQPGPKTRAGVAAPQERLGLKPSGEIDDALIEALGIVTADATAAPREVCVDLPPMPPRSLQCDPATTVLRGNACLCRRADMVRVSETQCR